MWLMRKIRVQYVGKEEYRPEQMPEKKWLPVIGFTSKKRTKVEQNGRQEIYEEPYFIVIGNNGIPLQVVAFNCKVIIDENAEISMQQLTAIAQNITIMGKALCEKLTGIHPSIEPEENKKELGENTNSTPGEPI